MKISQGIIKIKTIPCVSCAHPVAGESTVGWSPSSSMTDRRLTLPWHVMHRGITFLVVAVCLWMGSLAVASAEPGEPQSIGPANIGQGGNCEADGL